MIELIENLSASQRDEYRRRVSAIFKTSLRPHGDDGYAFQVAMGARALSGSDLLGKARRWGVYYSNIRARVVTVLRPLGVIELRVAHGRRVLAIKR